MPAHRYITHQKLFGKPCPYAERGCEFVSHARRAVHRCGTVSRHSKSCPFRDPL